jgi:ligand-binding sensor domain-containing protein/signal transduction histidine kinase
VRGIWEVTGFALIALMPAASAAQLPVRSYSAVDGLPGNNVRSIVRDSHGYLWFATAEGLARFDGYEFSAYTRANGLPRNSVSAFVQTRAGEYWAATAAGVARFEPQAPRARKFTVVAPDDPDARRVNVIYEDRAGRLWCGTENGLLRMMPLDAGRRQWRFLVVPLITSKGEPALDKRVISIYEDSRGDLWIGTMRALYRCARNGEVSEYHVDKRVGQWTDELWNQVLEDRLGRLWAATGVGLWRLDPDGAGDYRLTSVLIPKSRMVAWALLEDPAGTMWLGTSDGLVECPGGGENCAAGARVHNEGSGLSYRDVRALAKDCYGNLWMGTAGGGVTRLARNGLITYSASDGLAFSTNKEPALFHDRAGTVHVAFQHILNVRRGEKFLTISPVLPRGNSDSAWGWHQTVLQDHNGEWWLSTGQGLVRYPAVPIDALGQTNPKAVYSTANGLRTNDIFRIFEDRSGGIWVAAIGLLGVNGLSRWDRTTNRLQGFPVHDSTTASAFAEDQFGSVWIGYYDGMLARYRSGKMTLFGPTDGLAGGGIQALHFDHAGRLWIASLGGLARARSPESERPVFDRFGAEEGLASNLILCLEEDRWGRLYVATSRGLDRVNADGEIAPGRVRHYTQADGLARGELRDILFDRDGVLWCATSQGVSLLIPEAQSNSTRQPVLIRGLRVRGMPFPLSDLGAAFLPGLTFAPDQNQLQIDFATVAFEPGEVPHYQYRLEPPDPDWSSPSLERTVSYSNLAPGQYRFQARLAGAQSPAAVMEFTVLAPLWQRWWFRAALLCAALGLLYWLHRYRIVRLLEMERLRTRIASDLHDDIGSGLSQIAVLTEVARGPGHAGDLDAMLGNIGALSRELADSMRDIVWSVNPDRDYLRDLLQRMRRFASDVLTGKNIDFGFHASPGGEADRIPIDVRREVYLIFKETVNNIARHSACTRARIAFQIGNGWLELCVEDNGKGPGERSREDAHGLRSVSARARRIGGTIEFTHGDSGGLRVDLRVPLRTASWRG